MVVKIEEIREDGLELDEPIAQELLDAALLGEGKDTGFRARTGSRLKARLSRVSGGVLLEGEVVARLGSPCKRCLAEVAVELPVSFTLNLVPRQPQSFPGSPEGEDDIKVERGGSFSFDEAEEELFDGKTIELDPILREQILLGLPVSVLCREDCRGLCAVCGQNLNEQDCGCERKIPDPRLAKLKEIKLN